MEVYILDIFISEQIKQLIPNFKIGFIHYQGMEVMDTPQMIKGRMRLFQESIFFDLEDSNVTDIPSVKEWREIFKKTGKDPNRYRHSAESLLRRIKKQNYLEPINSSIDINNFFSLQYSIPIGIYDCANLQGNINIRIGKEGEQYAGLNGRMNSIENLIVSEDDIGPFGSPFVDSDRAPVQASTKNAIQIIYLPPSIANEKAEQMIESLLNMFVQVHGGEATFSIVE